MSLEIWFSCASLRLGFSNFWPRVLGVSDFCLLANGFDQNHDKSVNLLSLFLLSHFCVTFSTVARWYESSSTSSTSSPFTRMLSLLIVYSDLSVLHFLPLSLRPTSAASFVSLTIERSQCLPIIRLLCHASH